MRLIGQRPKVCVDIRNKIVQQDTFKLIEVERRTPTRAARSTTQRHIVGQTIGHNDNERLGFAGGDQVIHDQIGMA